MASSDSNWRNGSQNQGGDDGYNRRNKNPNRGKNRRYNQQWKPKPQGLFGEGDGPPSNGTNAQQEQRQGAPANSNQKSSFPPSTSTSSTSSSGSGSSSSPSTVVSQSPKSDASLSGEVTTPYTNLDGTIDLVTPNSSASEHDASLDGSNVLSDSNGNKSHGENIVTSNHANAGPIEPETPGSPVFESASENEDDGPVKNQGLEPKNGHPNAQAKSASSSSFVELADSEEEDGNESKEAAVTHASLVVNLADNKSPGINIKSFTTSSPSSSDSPSPLSSSRSAPPDVSGNHKVKEEPMDNAVAQAQAQAHFASPPLASTEQSAEDGERLSPEFPPNSKPYSAKKKNSVSFAPNTIDIEEVILGRPGTTPTAANPNANRPAVSPSILINGASGGGNISSETNWQQNSSSDSESENEDDDSSATVVTYNDLSEVKVIPNAQAQGGVDGVDDLAADEEVKEINSVSELPVTTTELVAPNGVKVYVVGTAHFSVKSQQDVIETIQKVQPNVVVLELCQSRRNILTLDEETILREASDLNFEKVRLAIRQSGAVQGMLHLLLLSMSAQITKKLGMAPGGEFRVGLHEASKIHNCMIYLGDRPFGITLSRALNALTLKQKIKLCWQFMTNNEDITKEEIERCKEKDLLEKMLIEMMGEYPSISQVFVHERDLYLAHSLWGAALSAHASVCHNRDHGHPLGSETGAVVGVVGMGHVAGIIKHWGKTTEEQISEITIVPEPSLQSRIIRKTIKISFYALLGYGTFKLSRKLFDFPSDALISRTVKGVPELVNKPLSMFRK